MHPSKNLIEQVMESPLRKITMKNSRIPLLISFSLLFILIGITSPAQSLVQSPSFEEFFNDPSLPEWQHTDPVYVQDGTLVLEKGGFAHHPESWSNFNITFQAAFDGHGDFIFHYKSNYLLFFNGERFLLQQADGENITEITKSVPHPLPSGEWFLVELIVEGDSHIIHINGKEIYSLNLSDPVPPGGIAYEIAGDAIARIDDLSVLNLDPFATDSSELTKGVDPIETGSKTQQASTHTPLSGKTQLTWVRTGGPPGGLGYDIRYNFDNPDIWYVTDNYGGVHISHDDGLTWQQGNQGIPPQSGSSGDATPVFCLTVDPHNSQIIWSGTDITGHIYKSTDGGGSWLEKDNGVEIEYDALSFRGFTVDPRSSDIVYAMGETTRHESGDAVWIPKGGVVYKTTDGGENWTLIWNGDIPSSLTRYLWVNPEDTNILYVSTGIFDRGAVGQVNPDQIGTSLDPYGGLGILKSTDGGKTWRTLGKEQGLDHLYVGSLYMDPEDPDILLAATGHNVPEAALNHYSKTNSSPIGVYRTTDGGESWSRVIAPLPGVGGEIFTSVEYCPSDNQIVYVGSNTAVYRSSDSGVSWDIVTGETPGWGPPGGLGGIPIDMQCDPRNPNRIFANNYQGGNYLSEDGGKTWKDASTGYTGAQIISVAVDPNQPSTVYSSGRNGVWLSTDAGLTWQAILNLSDDQVLFPEWGAIRVDPSQPERILLGIEGIYYTINQGQSWSYQPIPEINPMTAVIEFSPSNPRTIYAGGASANTMVHPEEFAGWGMVVTKDGGQTWESINGAGFIHVPVLDIAIDPIDSTTVYAATQNGLFKSTNSGKDWTSFSGLPKGATHTAGISPKNPDMLFAGVEQIGFYRSRDGGISWRQVSGGLEPNGSHRDLVFDPSNPQIVYLADLMSGVYRSTDGGMSWEKINNGLSTRAVTSLSISSDGQHLYAGTNGEGVFRLDLNGTSPEGSVSIINDHDEFSAKETNTTE
jgi:photosystem II stability/assembly factor-like uncharacterized protein